MFNFFDVRWWGARSYLPGYGTYGGGPGGPPSYPGSLPPGVAPSGPSAPHGHSGGGYPPREQDRGRDSGREREGGASGGMPKDVRALQIACYGLGGDLRLPLHVIMLWVRVDIFAPLCVLLRTSKPGVGGVVCVCVSVCLCVCVSVCLCVCVVCVSACVFLSACHSKRSGWPVWLQFVGEHTYVRAWPTQVPVREELHSSQPACGANLGGGHSRGVGAVVGSHSQGQVRLSHRLTPSPSHTSALNLFHGHHVIPGMRCARPSISSNKGTPLQQPLSWTC